MHVELKGKVKVEEGEEHTEANNMEDNGEKVGGKERDNEFEKDEESNGGNDFELDTKAKDTMGELKVKDSEGNTRTLKEWINKAKEFMKDHVG